MIRTTAALLFLGLGCNRDSPATEADTDTDADADTDSDVDADVDSDIDTDTDTDADASWAVEITGDDAWVDGGEIGIFDTEATVSVFSISFWVSSNGTPTSGAGMVGVGPPSGGGMQLYWSTETGDPTVAVSIQNTATTARAAVSDYTAWHHIVGVYDGPGDRLAVYVDGVLGDEIAPGVPYLDVEGLAFLGRFYDGPALRLEGRLDELAMYEAALSDADIAALAADRAVPPAVVVPTGLVAHWTLGDDVDGIGSTTADTVAGFPADLISGAVFVPAD